MKKSPVFPGFDTDHNDKSTYEFDLQSDFTQFLEEAKKFANQKKLYPMTGEETGKKQVIKQEKKGKKKSWKTALFSFWRSSSDNKVQQQPKDQPLLGCHISANPKPRGHVSGPVYAIGGAPAATGGGQRHRFSASGSLTNLFSKRKKEQDNEIPYVSLDKLNKPQYDAKVYGPVYLVS